MSYSQIFFNRPCALRTHRRYLLRFSLGVSQPMLRGGLRDDPLPAPWPRRRRGAPAQARLRKMRNWVDCDVAFSEVAPPGEADNIGEDSECSSTSTNGKSAARPTVRGQIYSKCKLAKYYSAEHQHKDWEEHRRLCIKPAQAETENAEV